MPEVLARMALHHSCDRVVEITAARATRRPLHVGEEFGAEWLGRPRVVEVADAGDLSSCVLVVCEEALHRLDTEMLSSAAVCVVTESPQEPERDAASRESQGSGGGLPRNERFEAALREAGLEPEFLGLARTRSPTDTTVALLRGDRRTAPADPPAAFRVLAVMTAFNEADVIVPSVGRLLEQGVEVRLIDNWSTDGTERLVESAFGPRVTVERFPKAGPSGVYQWGDMLERVAEIARSSGADWVVHHDADERRSGPWEGLDLRASLYRVQCEGYNAVDHTVIEFPPVDDSFEPGGDFEQHFRFFSPTETVANRIQVKAWSSSEVDLRSSGGHEARFCGRKVHPLNFLLKHYPVRSQAHGERKVLGERKPRIASEEQGRWHTHYDHVRQGHSFVRDPRDLSLFDEEFPRRWLLERLYGFGAARPGGASGAARRSASEVLRRLGLLEGARATRRIYRLARRRHPDSGRR